MTTPVAGLYERPADGLFYSPFSLDVDPMARLMLINFSRDPDAVYNGFEPQVFDDPVHGRGLMVIAYHPGGTFDIYHQPSLTLDRATYDVVGKGLRELAARPLEGARFDITPTGVDLDIQFDDLLGRPVRLRIAERGRKRTKPFPILAPMGNTAERPPALPLYFLHDFYFVRRARTELTISVDGRDHKPDSIPMLLDGSRVHFLRYAADPFLVNWNPAHNGPLTGIPVNGNGRPRRHRVSDGDVTYDLAYRAEHPEIAGMGISNGRRTLVIDFAPSFPNVAALADGVELAGRFLVRPDVPAGYVGGVYHVTRQGDRVDIHLRPSDGWRPGVNRWSVQLIFGLVPLFRRWPTTYEWVGQVTLGDGPPRLRSEWRRLGREGQGRFIRLFGD